jgi:diacylglycerol kinase (ATP)
VALLCSVAIVDSILLLTNVKAGSAHDEKLDVAVAALRTSATVEVCITSRQDELDDVLNHLGRRQLVVAGGDGSFHAVVAALNRRNELRQTVLGLIPVGTGNDFARAVGIPLDPEAAARAVLARKVGPIDLVVDSAGDVVVNNVRVGMGADASRQAIKWKKRLGRLGYAIGAVKSALQPHVLQVLIVVDEEIVADVDGAVLDISIGNGATVGGGLPVNPAAHPQSGQMDVMLSFAIGPVARIGYGIDLLRCRHLTRRDVLHRRGNTVSISGTAFYPSSDGEISGPVSSRTWRVVKSAFQMTLP